MSVERTYELHQYDRIFKIKLLPSSYIGGCFAIAMESLSEDGKYWEAYDALTTNLSSSRRSGTYAYVQTDKYLEFVLNNQLGKATGKVVGSGFNLYTEIHFNEELFSVDEDSYDC